MSDTIPVIDIAVSVAAGRAVGDVAEQIDWACRETGFFAVVGHGKLRAGVLDATQRFFALPANGKAQLAIENSPHSLSSTPPTLTSALPRTGSGAGRTPTTAPWRCSSVVARLDFSIRDAFGTWVDRPSTA
jgi:isopenicillin N synthase-like dioxygenase